MSETLYDASNLSISNGFGRNRDRYYLEEFFKRRPALNADISNSSEGTRMIANPDFELLGENMTSALCTFSSTRSGIVLTTAGATSDQAILLPHLDNNQTAWTGIKFGTENQVEWECAISVGDISNVCFWAGLKKSNTPLLDTDTDQAYFIFDSSNSVIGTSILTTEANMHFVYSVDNTDYTTDLNFAVAANTIYKLRISIDSDRKISIFVGSTNSSGVITPMTQYGLTSTSGTAGVTESTVSTKSSALKNDVDLIPYVGVQSTSAAADALTVYYEKISRTLFE